MEINFKNKKIRDLCEIGALATRKLGPDCSRKLRARLNDLEAASCVTELVVGNPHALTGDLAEMFALNLAKGWRLVFTPDNDPCPRHEDNGIDWSQVTIICIEYIGDYHD